MKAASRNGFRGTYAMSQSLWGILCSIPYNLICVWAILRMVPSRRPWLFALLWQVGCIPLFFISGESSYGWLRTALSTVLWLTLVLAFAEKRSLRAAFGAVLISLLSVVAEVVAAMLSLFLFGRYVDNAAVANEPRIMLLVQLIFWNIFALLCWVLVRVWKRSARSQETVYLRWFALLPLSQHLLVMLGGTLSLVRHASAGSYLLLGSMALCCALADFLLFRGLRNYADQQLARQQAEQLEKQLAQQLAYYDGVVARIEETARLRHELHNQLQTFYALMDRREYDRARELLTAFAAPLTDGKEAL